MLDSFDHIEKLAQGCSIQAKRLNNVVISLFVYCLFILSLEVGDFKDKGEIQMPFSLGKVNPMFFTEINMVFVLVFMIIFTASYIQVYRSKRILEDSIKNLDNRKILGIDVSDYVDTIVSHPYTRVGVIAQYLQGNYQFFHSAKTKWTKTNRVISLIIYVFLRLLIITLIFSVPFLTIVKSWGDIFLIKNKTFIPIWIIITLMVLSICLLLMVMFSDLKLTYKNMKKVYNSKNNY